MPQTTAAEVRLDAGRAARFSASVRSTGGFDRLPRTRCAICRCSRRPKGRSWSRNDPESGECRFMPHVFISYVRENKDVVDRLEAELSSRGVRVWLDRNNIEPGARWPDAIKNAIR